MIVSRRKFISGSILAIVLLVIVGYIFKDLDSLGKSLFSILGFIIIGIISIYNILKDARIISMNKFYWYFQFVFMSVAPMCQYLSGYFPWGVKVAEQDIKMAICLIIIWNILYIMFYRKNKKNLKLGVFGNEISKLVIRDRKYSGLLLSFIFICSIAGFLVLAGIIGFYNLFFRAENALNFGNSTISFVVRKFLTAFPAMACTIFIFVNKRKKTHILKIGIIILFFLTVCANFPTSTTRYWMGTIFTGIFFSAYISRRESRVIDYGIILGLFIAFPVFYMFKTLTITDLFAGDIEFSGIAESLNTVDFDAFSVVARAVRYVRENGITWGNQLINIILFFVPRKIWTSKPITTNVLIASSQDQQFTNISCPLVGEGYVNFGMIGIVLYCFLYAKFNKYIDDLFWNRSDDNKINFINMLYPFLCVITLYINRGPLQPSFIQTIALCLPLIVISLFSKSYK